MNHAAAIHQQDLETLLQTLERLESYKAFARKVCMEMETLLTDPLNRGRKEIFLMFRNKLGLTKEQAQKLYFRYRKGGSEEIQVDSDQPGTGKEPETNEEKIALIMDYMKETSAKLDRIEDDIASLKEQVNQILRKL